MRRRAQLAARVVRLTAGPVEFAMKDCGEATAQNTVIGCANPGLAPGLTESAIPVILGYGETGARNHVKTTVTSVIKPMEDVKNVCQEPSAASATDFVLETAKTRAASTQGCVTTVWTVIMDSSVTRCVNVTLRSFAIGTEVIALLVSPATGACTATNRVWPLIVISVTAGRARATGASQVVMGPIATRP